MKLSIKLLAEHVLTIPTDPAQPATQVTMRIWELEVNNYVKQKATLTANLITLYIIIWGKSH